MNLLFRNPWTKEFLQNTAPEKHSLCLENTNQCIAGMHSWIRNPDYLWPRFALPSTILVNLNFKAWRNSMAKKVVALAKPYKVNCQHSIAYAYPHHFLPPSLSHSFTGTRINTHSLIHFTNSNTQHFNFSLPNQVIGNCCCFCKSLRAHYRERFS